MNVKQQIEKTINQAGSVSAAAKALNMPRKTLEEWRNRSEWPDSSYKTRMVKNFLDHACAAPRQKAEERTV